ncbi:hypothetical protein EDM68_02570 [Candidatus Uhrbacteria bacterium]|nr:MAG: hypothetical protein EDM68_02570 [Candidatus Uhrbacteria bacterium]
MVPLAYFLIAWLVFIGVFALMSFITILMNLRYGLSGSFTYVTTGIFVGVSCLVLLAAGGYLFTVDWTQDVNLLPGTQSILEL